MEGERGACRAGCPAAAAALLQADGRQDIENQTNTGDGGDCFPGQLARKGINDDSNPSTRDANGAATGVSITDVSASAQTMRASLYVVPPMIRR